MSVLKTLQYKGYTIEIHQDTDPMNPREEFDHVGKMVCFCNRYKLGDKHEFSNPTEAMEHIKATKAIWLPLYLYDHSGITMNTTGFGHCDPGCWDSGQVGYIFIEREKVLEEYSAKALTKKIRDKAEELLRGEVEEYDQYLTGQVYGFVVKKGVVKEDSSWGFFGDDGYCLDEAKSVVDYNVNIEIAKHAKKVKAYIKNKVPLQSRLVLA
jgi:hypothetical protein